MERKKELGGNFYLNLVVRDAPESAKAHDTDTDHRSEKKGNSFNECTTTPTIVDLMNPFMGLYAIPTVGQYRQDGYPSGELKVIVGVNTKSLPTLSLPSFLLQSLTDSAAKTYTQTHSKQGETVGKKHKTKTLKNKHRKQPDTHESFKTRGRHNNMNKNKNKIHNETNNHANHKYRSNDNNESKHNIKNNINNNSSSNNIESNNSQKDNYSSDTKMINNINSSSDCVETSGGVSAGVAKAFSEMRVAELKEPSPLAGEGAHACARAPARITPARSLRSDAPPPHRPPQTVREPHGDDNRSLKPDDSTPASASPGEQAAPASASQDAAAAADGGERMERAAGDQGTGTKGQSKRPRKAEQVQMSTGINTTRKTNINTALKLNSNKAMGIMFSGPTAPASEAKVEAMMEGVEVYFVVSDVTWIVQSQRAKKRSQYLTLNLLNHAWCFPQANPMHRHKMWAPCGAFVPSFMKDTVLLAKQVNHLPLNHLDARAVSIHPSRSGGVCCSPNNAQFNLLKTAPLAVLFTATHTPCSANANPKGKRGPAQAKGSRKGSRKVRKVVTLQWLLNVQSEAHKAVHRALNEAIQTSETLTQLLGSFTSIIASLDGGDAAMDAVEGAKEGGGRAGETEKKNMIDSDGEKTGQEERREKAKGGRHGKGGKEGKQGGKENLKNAYEHAVALLRSVLLGETITEAM